MVSNQLKEKTQKNDNPCIWMQAGVVRRKDCRTDFDCTACRFDSVMRRVAADNQRIREEGRMPKGKRG
ncbi:MAG: hypothetical protein PVG87_15755, partial [Desulfobacteraceae bacterium]